MSELIESAVALLQERGTVFPEGVAKFVLTGHGAFLLDVTGARPGDTAADITLTAEAEVFRALLEGRLKPMPAYLSGKLQIDGGMALALKLANALA
jgi:putative sterol carrier protein